MKIPVWIIIALIVTIAAVINLYVSLSQNLSVAVMAVVTNDESHSHAPPSLRFREQQAVFYQDTTVTTRKHRLEDDIKETMKCYDNPGLAISVVRNGEKIFAEGFGVTSPRKRNKVTSKTLFSIASLTKAFTAALLLDVMAKNESIRLSSTLRDVIGNGFSFNDTLRTEYATVEDLLSHRLKMPDNEGFRFNPLIDRQELLKRVKYFESNQEFRVKGIYSSTGYIMAAAITELIGKSPWEKLMRQTIFGPLDMTSSNFAASVNFDDENVSPPISTFDGQLSYIDPAFTKQWNSRCGSGCIFSTADDMSHWMNFHLTKGKDSRGQQVFPKTSVSNLHTPRTLLPTVDLSIVRKPRFPVTQMGDLYALGWRVGYYRGYLTLTHTGSTPGYASIITLIPSENFGVFIVMNGDDESAYHRLSLQNYITDVTLGLKPWLNISTICSFPQPWQPRKSISSPVYDIGLKPFRKWTDYVGVYGNDGYGEIYVEFNAEIKHLTARFGFGLWQLHPQKTKGMFYGKGLEVTNFYDIDFVMFEVHSQSDLIVALIVKGFNKSVPPVFHRVAELADVTV